ncbi:MAG: type II toxin-antitoxin system HicB family antitoxin [Rickettsia endosymbiont of Ecitomorpha arachnoides]|nr:type II toxin-antitoxin system HicB family antitoxin [Rickettsia endosymbiont of Sceptobius lativentris]MCC8462512.1 type II toxin-antitoxin system HicB family antitoxin [Rickettsia endosymbiont of Ecitomorpha arachnoides]
MKTNDEFDGFTIELFKDTDGDWLARFEELPNVSAFGKSPEKALQELQQAWTLMKESYLSYNQSIPLAPSRKEYSGQFNIRVDKRVHRALALEALRAKISLNALVSQKLTLSVNNEKSSYSS